MENSYRYFKNDQCKYYPCHKIEEGQDFNCLFLLLSYELLY